MTHLEKGWLLPIAGRKKFITSVFYHKLSQVLDKRKFDVVYEGYADPFDLESEQPDVVVYDKKDHLRLSLLIEFCTDNNEEDVLRTMEIISKIYKAKEAYVYNFQSCRWHKFMNGGQQVSVTSSYSNLLGIDMNSALNSSMSRYYAA